MDSKKAITAGAMHRVQRSTRRTLIRGSWWNPRIFTYYLFFHCCFETGSYIVQTGLKLFFILPLPLKSWDHLAHKSIFVGLPEVMVVQTMGVNTLTWAEKEGWIPDNGCISGWTEQRTMAEGLRKDRPESKNTVETEKQDRKPAIQGHSKALWQDGSVLGQYICALLMCVWGSGQCLSMLKGQFIYHSGFGSNSQHLA